MRGLLYRSLETAIALTLAFYAFDKALALKD